MHIDATLIKGFWNLILKKGVREIAVNTQNCAYWWVKGNHITEVLVGTNSKGRGNGDN